MSNARKTKGRAVPPRAIPILPEVRASARTIADQGIRTDVLGAEVLDAVAHGGNVVHAEDEGQGDRNPSPDPASDAGAPSLSPAELRMAVLNQLVESARVIRAVRTSPDREDPAERAAIFLAAIDHQIEVLGRLEQVFEQ